MLRLLHRLTCDCEDLFCIAWKESCSPQACSNDANCFKDLPLPRPLGTLPCSTNAHQQHGKAAHSMHAKSAGVTHKACLESCSGAWHSQVNSIALTCYEAVQGVTQAELHAGKQTLSLCSMGGSTTQPG